MTECNHHPIFQARMLFSSRVNYVCKNCGAQLEMTPRFKIINRVLNGLTIGGLAYLVLTGNVLNPTAGTGSSSTYFLSMGAIIVAFVALQTLLILFGQFQEIETKDLPSGTPNQTDADTQENAVEEKPQYTKEQLELMELYEFYAKKEREENESNPDYVAPAAAAAVPEPEEDLCEHVPAKNWKNYVPGVYDFKCEHCGKVITFSASRKRKLNLILLGCSTVVLMASFSNMSMPFWQLMLLALGVLIVCSGVQYFFVKNSTFERKP